MSSMKTDTTNRTAVEWVKGHKGVLAVIFLILFCFIVFFPRKTNNERARKLSNVVEDHSNQKVADSSDIIKRMYLPNGSEFMEALFYRGNEVIAKQKLKNYEIVETQGNIPDGPVKFFDSYRNTYGEEIYYNNLRNGRYKEYYNSGNIRTEADYRSGRLFTKREYFSDGILRLEADYSDARLFTGLPDVGRGKLYNRDGKVKYEWDITNKNPKGFQKTYNNRGGLIAQTFYDGEGKVIHE